jgi:hypothetical protein
VLANRVRDVVTVLTWARQRGKRVQLAAFDRGRSLGPPGAHPFPGNRIESGHRSRGRELGIARGTVRRYLRGGSPTRSGASRRSRVRRGVGGEGASQRAASEAATNASIGLRDSAARGTGGRATGTYAQCGW